MYSTLCFVRLELFAGTKIGQFLLEYQPCQFGIEIQHSRDCCLSGGHSLMMGAGQVCETLGSCPEFTWLVAQQDLMSYVL
jgi:hypothetical protein